MAAESAAIQAKLVHLEATGKIDATDRRIYARLHGIGTEARTIEEIGNFFCVNPIDIHLADAKVVGALRSMEARRGQWR